MHLACVVGARPNFMKMAPLLRAIATRPSLQATLIHTGQHYDANLSDVFFEQLAMPRPDVHLEVGSGRHGQQTARVLERMEEVLSAGVANGAPFDRLVVVGDVNSTMAATLAAAKLEIPVAHVEAGLRSHDRRMPEEINRIVTDALSDMLLVSEPAGIENLRAEGRPDDQMHLVGNVMIDTLQQQLEVARSLPVLDELSLSAGEYAVVTLHRPSNVDAAASLGPIIEVLADISRSIPVVWPVHPRTAARLETFGLAEQVCGTPTIRRLDPLGYREFLCLMAQAKVLVTDSGGLQEESTALGIPCLTMRENTERPITVEKGTSTLCGNDAVVLRAKLEEVAEGRYKTGRCPDLWDGRASERIVDVLAAG